MSVVKIIVASLIGTVILLGGLAIGKQMGVNQQSPEQQKLGSFTPVEGTPFTISKTVLPADSTITLSSFKTPDGHTLLTMSNFGTTGYGTLDPVNLSRLESVSFTGITQNGDGSATLTGVSRGLSFVSPYAASSTLQQTHLVGSQFILSNTSAFYGNEFLFSNQTGTSTAPLVFNSSTGIPHYDFNLSAAAWTAAASSTLVSLGYAQSLVLAGCANGTTILQGCVQLATALQAASSTVTGSTGANDVLASKYATDTPNTATRGTVIPMTTIAGYLQQAWLDLTATWTWTGLGTFSGGLTSSGTTTISGSSLTTNPFVGNLLPYKLPSVRGASSTVPTEDGSGNITWEQPFEKVLVLNTNVNAAATSASATTTAYEYAMPANTLTTVTAIRAISTWVASGSNTCWLQIDIGNGTATTTLGIMSVAPAGNTPVQMGADLFATSTTGTYGLFRFVNNQTTFTLGGLSGSNQSTGGFSSMNLAAVTYIDFRGRINSGGSGSCNLDAVSVEVIHQ